MEQTGAATLDEVQVLVHLVGAVKGHVERHEHAVDHGALIQVAQREAGLANQALGLASRGNKGHAAVEAGALGGDGLDDVDDGAAGADADEAGAGQKVLLDGLVGGGLLSGLDERRGVCSGGHGAGCCCCCCCCGMGVLG